MEAVDQMLLQTCVVAYHRTLRLQLKADMCSESDEAAIYNNAASKRIGKVGDLALVIKRFRSPLPQKSVQIVGQQNVVANGDQSVTYVDAGNGRQSLSSRDEVNSNPSVDAAEGRISGTGNLNQESPSGGGGAAKPDATAVVV
jgi:hypothetical protein